MPHRLPRATADPAWRADRPLSQQPAQQAVVGRLRHTYAQVSKQALFGFSAHPKRMASVPGGLGAWGLGCLGVLGAWMAGRLPHPCAQMSKHWLASAAHITLLSYICTELRLRLRTIPPLGSTASFPLSSYQSNQSCRRAGGRCCRWRLRVLRGA